MRFFRSWIFFIHLLMTSIRASMSIRGAFIFETFLMVGNNLIFFSVWWIFFRQFNDIAGWQIKEMTVMMAVGTGAYGLMQLCFGGVRQLSRTIMQGDLDPFMTQPKNLLIHLIGSRSLAKGWGHILTTFVLLFLEGLFIPQTVTLVVVGVVCGCLVFTSMSVIAHSLAFWLGPLEAWRINIATPSSFSLCTRHISIPACSTLPCSHLFLRALLAICLWNWCVIFPGPSWSSY